MKTILFVFLALFLIFSVSIVSSENYVFKWQLCDAMNQSGIDCDNWWDGFKTTKGIQEENKTLIINTTDWSKLYNKTETNSLINALMNDSEVRNLIEERINNISTESDFNSLMMFNSNFYGLNSGI